MAENGDFEYEEGLSSWLLSDVLDDAFDPKENLMKKKQQYERQLHRTSAEQLFPHNTRQHQRPRSPTWAAGGAGMQAIFLESGQKSGGTGVFLPRSKKPACSPVLLPARVVQALNLNVHALGLQISPNKENYKNMNPEVGDMNSVKRNKTENKTSVHCCVISSNSSSSADIFLPKEWTY